MKKILVLEDNVVTLKYIMSLVQDLDNKNVIFACSDVRDAYKYALEKRLIYLS